MKGQNLGKKIPGTGPGIFIYPKDFEVQVCYLQLER